MTVPVSTRLVHRGRTPETGPRRPGNPGFVDRRALPPRPSSHVCHSSAVRGTQTRHSAQGKAAVPSRCPVRPGGWVDRTRGVRIEAAAVWLSTAAAAGLPADIGEPAPPARRQRAHARTSGILRQRRAGTIGPGGHPAPAGGGRRGGGAPPAPAGGGRGGGRAARAAAHRRTPPRPWPTGAILQTASAFYCRG